nr:hypothetical protein BaRGS_008464 [Batillaria attramentaria]
MQVIARGAADINLLANSLTTRLRKAARQKAAASNAASLAAARLASEFQDLEDADGSDEEKVQKSSKKKRSSHSQLAARRSILKRTVSNEMADRYRYSPDESLTSSSSVSDHHLPNVFGDRRLSASTGQLDQVGTRSENGKKSPGKKSSLAQVSNGVGAGGGSQGRGGYVSNGPVRLVKRAGIFIPVDKYAQGRQTLHGEDAPFGHHVPVDYETVTIRPGTPDSEKRKRRRMVQRQVQQEERPEGVVEKPQRG